VGVVYASIAAFAAAAGITFEAACELLVSYATSGAADDLGADLSNTLPRYIRELF